MRAERYYGLLVQRVMREIDTTDQRVSLRKLAEHIASGVVDLERHMSLRQRMMRRWRRALRRIW